MRPVNEKLRADLLEAGKREFMEDGILKKYSSLSWSNNWSDLPLLYGQGGIV